MQYYGDYFDDAGPENEQARAAPVLNTMLFPFYGSDMGNIISRPAGAGPNYSSMRVNGAAILRKLPRCLEGRVKEAGMNKVEFMRQLHIL